MYVYFLFKLYQFFFYGFMKKFKIMNSQLYYYSNYLYNYYDYDYYSLFYIILFINICNYFYYYY